MNNLKLTGLGLHEMSQGELVNTNGGVFWLVPVIVGIGLTQIFMHWDHFKEGLQGAPELVENQASRQTILN